MKVPYGRPLHAQGGEMRTRVMLNHNVSREGAGPGYHHAKVITKELSQV